MSEEAPELVFRATIHLDEVDRATLSVVTFEHKTTNSDEAEIALRNRMAGFRKNPVIRRKVENLLGYRLEQDDGSAG